MCGTIFESRTSPGLTTCFAEPIALRCAQDILQPTIGLLHLGERRLDLGQASFQMGILTGKNS